MKNLMMPCVVSLALAMTAPNLFAGSQSAEKTAPIAGVTAKSHDLAPVATGHDSSGQDATRKTESARSQRLDVRVQAIAGEGLQFEIRQLDGQAGSTYLIVFYQLENQLVLLDILDGRHEDQVRFGLDLDVFAQMPVAVMPARVRGKNTIDLGPLQSAAELAERSGQ